MRKYIVAGFFTAWAFVAWFFIELAKDFIFGSVSGKLVSWFGVSEADVVNAIAQYASYLVPASAAGIAVGIVFFIGRIVERHKQKPRVQSGEQAGKSDPVYWSLSETLSWIAFGEAISAKQWVGKNHSENLDIDSEKEMARFNEAERDLFEKLRARELVALGKKNNSESYEDIPDIYFLSDVSCAILHDQIDVNPENLGAVLKWDGPKWRDVRLKREDVKREWPAVNT